MVVYSAAAGKGLPNAPMIAVQTVIPTMYGRSPSEQAQRNAKNPRGGGCGAVSGYGVTRVSNQRNTVSASLRLGGCTGNDRGAHGTASRSVSAAARQRLAESWTRFAGGRGSSCFVAGHARHRRLVHREARGECLLPTFGAARGTVFLVIPAGIHHALYIDFYR